MQIQLKLTTNKFLGTLAFVKMETSNGRRALKIYLLVASIALVSPRSCSNTPFYVNCKDGDVVLAGLFSIHEKTTNDECDNVLNPQQLASAEAMVYAIEQVNKNPYLLPNITLGYRIFDSCGIPARANTIAFSFVMNNALNKHFQELNATQEEIYDLLPVNISKQPIALAIGPVDSASSVVVASTLQIGNIPFISPSATSDELSQSHYRTFFRTVPPDSQQAKAISDIIEYFNWTYIAIIGSDTSYGRYGVRALENEAHERETYYIHSIEYFPPSGYERKIQRILAKLKRAVNVQVVVLWGGDISSIQHVFQESYKLELFDRTWIAPDGWSETASLFTPEFSAVIGGFVGTTFRQFNVSSFDKHLLETNSSSLRIKDNMWWKEFWQSVNNCSKLVWKGCGKNMTKMSVDLVSVVQTSSIAYVMDAVQAAALAIDSVYRCQHDQLKLSQVTCTGSLSNIHSRDVLHALTQVEFQGITGSINFNHNGDSLRSAAYDVVNLQVLPRGTPLLKKVGNWDRVLKEKLQLKKDWLVWKNGSTVIPTSRCSEFCRPGTRQTSPVACCWECISCPSGTISTGYSSTNCTPCQADEKSVNSNTLCEKLPFDNLTWKDSRGVILAVIAVIGVILTLFALGVFLKYRDTPVVKSSNRHLSYAFLLSILVAFFSASVLINGPTMFSCVTYFLLDTMFFNLCVSILFLKTSRLVHVFNFQALKSHWFYNRSYQFIALGILNLFPVALITVFLIMRPPSLYMTIVPFQYKILQCRVIGTTEIIVWSAVSTYELILSLMVAYYAFRARKLPSNFNETKYIAFNMYIQLITRATTLVIFSSLQPGSFREILCCIVQLCSTYSFLLCIFAPKLFIILRHPERNTPDFVKAAVARNTMERSLSNSLISLSVVSIAEQGRKSRSDTSSTGLSVTPGWPVMARTRYTENKRAKDHALRRDTWPDHSSLTGNNSRDTCDDLQIANGVCSLTNQQVQGNTSGFLEENGIIGADSEHKIVNNADLAYCNAVMLTESVKNGMPSVSSAKRCSDFAENTRL